MRRPKNGAFVSAKLDKALSDRLQRFVDETRYTKTAVIEKSLRAFLDREAPLAEPDGPGGGDPPGG